jgi:membrane-bound lytic murein transglycosylase D
MTSLTSLALVADITETPLTELAALNPALLKSMAPEGYTLHVPKGMGNQLVAALQMVPSEHRDAWRMHRVEPGETLEAIGKRYGAAQSEIIAVNKLESAEVAEGDHLLIPASPAPAVTVRTASKKSSGKKTQTASSRKTPGKQTTTASTGKSKGKTTSASTSSKGSKSTSAKTTSNSRNGTSAAGTRHKTPAVTRTASR